MTKNYLIPQVLGGLLAVVGIVGVFARISSNDGALAISGAIILAAGMVSEAIVSRRAK